MALPRVRDFRGVSAKAFDGRGNYTLGVREQIIFPEIDYDKIDKIKGLNVTIVTSARTDEEGKELLKLLGMPFRQLTHGRGSTGSDLKEDDLAKTSAQTESNADPQVQGPSLQPLPDLRPAARLPAPVRCLPHLLPQHGLPGEAPGSDQVQLVAGDAAGFARPPRTRADRLRAAAYEQRRTRWQLPIQSPTC